MKTSFSIVFLCLLAVIVVSQDDEKPRQVVPLGDPSKGQVLFEEKSCFRCHTVEGVRFPDADLPGVDFIHLGGDNNRKMPRDFFAAQIMDPAHLISPEYQKIMTILGDRLGAENSPMPNFNKALTVEEMIDLASFLEEQSR